MQKITLQEKRDLDTLFNVLYVKKQSKFIEFYKSVFAAKLIAIAHERRTTTPRSFHVPIF